MKKSRVYTRTGDKGFSSLVGGQRVPKTHLRLEAYGTIDELNAYLGLLLTYLSDEEDICFVQKIQQKLFVVGGYLATETEMTLEVSSCHLIPNDVLCVECEIDRLDALLPSLNTFVLPGGTRASALCHVCRTICRRAERRILSLSEAFIVEELVLSYINRLSDYFFILSRKINLLSHKSEIMWDNSSR